MTLHHYGFVTSSLEKTESAFHVLGYKTNGKKIFDSVQKVNLLFLDNGSGHLLELVQPERESRVGNILQRNGPSLYHICYEVRSISRAIENLRTQRFVVIVKPVPAIAFDNRLISFLYSRQVGLIELLESNL